MQMLNFTEPKLAFSRAIAQGELTVNPLDERYAGKWMYMYTSNDGSVNYFKNINYRNYIEIPNREKNI